ncbi:Fc.00g045350.m01.CDS01 [Cosmosporella sp. VM-42]
MLNLLVFLAIGASLSIPLSQDIEDGPTELSAAESEATYPVSPQSIPPLSSLLLSVRRRDMADDFDDTARDNGTALPFPGIPFPKQNWHGLRRPNYTNLYLNYTEPVYCIRTWRPIGLNGFANWLASVVVLTQDFCETVRFADISCFSVISNFASTAFFSISVTRGFKAYSSCAKQVQEGGGLYVVDGQKVTHKGNSFAFLFLSGPFILDGVNLTIQSIHLFCGIWFGRQPWLAMTVFVIKLLALLAMLLMPFFFYTGYTNFLYADNSMGGPIACVVTIVVCVVFGMVVYLAIKRGIDVLGLIFNPGVIFFLLFILFHFVCVGLSYLLLGRTIDDPWGKTSAGNPLGKLQAVADGVIPLITVLSSLAAGN